MGLETKADDWQVASIAQVGGATKGGAGYFWFKFKSKQADIEDVFGLSAAGIGLGGSIG